MMVSMRTGGPHQDDMNGSMHSLCSGLQQPVIVRLSQALGEDWAGSGLGLVTAGELVVAGG